MPFRERDIRPRGRSRESAVRPMCRWTRSCCPWRSPPTPRFATASSSVTRRKGRSSCSPPRAASMRDIDPAGFNPRGDLLALVSNLTLLALVGIVDPPRAEAKVSIAKATGAGMKVRMITGDHAVTAEAIARELGIRGQVMTGQEFGALSEADAEARIDEVGVIARVTPEHKVKLVEVLRHHGDVVAMTGDGVNDAPALKDADIGVAMGITGTEVAKEAAVMILTDDNFATIVKAVEEGRSLYDNLMRYIRFQIGTLFGFVGIFLGAAIFNILGGIPFLPLYTFWLNHSVRLSR